MTIDDFLCTVDGICLDNAEERKAFIKAFEDAAMRDREFLGYLMDLCEDSLYLMRRDGRIP